MKNNNNNIMPTGCEERICSNCKQVYYIEHDYPLTTCLRSECARVRARERAYYYKNLGSNNKVIQKYTKRVYNKQVIKKEKHFCEIPSTDKEKRKLEELRICKNCHGIYYVARTNRYKICFRPCCMKAMQKEFDKRRH